MTLSALGSPHTDPTPIFDWFRAHYASELLTAAIAHFKVFEQLSGGPLTFAALREQLGLAERPAVVLICACAAWA